MYRGLPDVTREDLVLPRNGAYSMGMASLCSLIHAL